jgi:hypothetical protein
MKDINICFNAIDKYFTFLKIIGGGFLAILGVYSFIKDIFGEIIAKGSLMVSVMLIAIIILTIFDKFNIIKQIRRRNKR